MLSKLATRFRSSKDVLSNDSATIAPHLARSGQCRVARRCAGAAGRRTRRCPSREPRSRPASPAARSSSSAASPRTAATRPAWTPTRSRSNRWRRLPDLPLAVDHAAAASANGRVYVVGGYGGDRAPLDTAFVLERREPGAGSRRSRTRAPPRRPRSPAASSTSSAASTAAAALARVAFALDLSTRPLGADPGPVAARASRRRRRRHARLRARRPQCRHRHEHGALRGLRRAHAALDAARARSAGARRHRRRVRRTAGSSRSAASARRERSAPSTPTSSGRSAGAGSPTSRSPRHGLGVVAHGGRVYAVAGGPVARA